MLKKILFAFVFTFSLVINAQTTLIDPSGDGGFSNGLPATFASNNWEFRNGPAFPFLPFTSYNRFVVNTGAASPTGSSAYISNDIDGAALPTFAYGDASQDTNAPKFYRDITFPAAETTITLNFDWRGDGEASDYLRVWLVPSSYNPPSLPTSQATPIIASGTAPTGNVQISANLNTQPGWTNTTIVIPAVYAGTSAKLVFEWRTNDADGTGTTPAAIDNISLISQTIITYCAPSSTNPDDWIDDFSTNVGGGASEISNLNSGFTATGYQDNSGTAAGTVEQLAGASVNFTAGFGNTFNDPTDTYGFNIWVDWNTNGDFTDTGEKVYASGTFLTGVNADFTIPPGTPLGDYRMRIRADFFNDDPNSCGSISFGEAEDYTVTVVDVNCVDDPSNITISAISFTTSTIVWDPALPAPLSYEYFVTTNTDVPLYNQVPTGTTTSPTTTANLTGLIDGTTYYVWVRSVCSSGFSGKGNWIGSTSFTTLVLPPTTTNISICPGDTGLNYLTAFSSGCTAPVNLGTQLPAGALTAGSDPTALRPSGATNNTCDYYTSTSNYQGIDFVVDSDGTYTFEMDYVPVFDSMGYIVLNDGNFTPGLCNGTWLQSNDDGGVGNSPRLTVSLVAGLSYTLYTTVWSISDITASGSYLWNMSGPGSFIGPPAGSLDWYTTPTGGSSIFSGINFDPVSVLGSGLPNTNTTGIYSYWAACSSTPSVRAQADFIIGKVWTGATDSDWDTATNWSPSGVPTDTECVVIPNVANPPIINAATNGLGNRLIVQSGGTLTQNPNSTLTITDAVTVNAGGTYSIENNGSLIQINDVANTVDGTFEIERTANIRRSDYVYWSSPVASFNIENVSPGTPNGYKYEWLPTVGSRLPGPGPDFDPNDYGDWQGLDSGAMQVGKGYAIKGPTGHSTAASDYTALFTGTPNNGTITQTIERGTYTGVGYSYIPNGFVTSLSVTSDDDNWNLVGNPFPSAIDADAFLELPANIHSDGAIYLWTHGTALAAGNDDTFYDGFIYSYSAMDYITYNAFGSNPPGFAGAIASGQGFFVVMEDTGPNPGTVTFDNSMRRRSDGTAYDNNQFYRSANSSEENTDNKHRIWLDFIDASGNTNTTLFGYANGATNQKDRLFDAKTTTGNGLNLYSMINDDAYIIQGRQMPFVNTDEVPLGINITVSGIQTIAINSLDGLFHDTDQQIYIEDIATGIIHNLTNAPYTFTSDVGVFNNRFIIRYTPESTLNVKDFDTLNGIKVFEENDELVVKSENETIQSIEVYDMLGRTLFKNASINLNRFAISVLSPNNSALFLKIKLVNGQQKIAKVIF